MRDNDVINNARATSCCNAAECKWMHCWMEDGGGAAGGGRRGVGPREYSGLLLFFLLLWQSATPSTPSPYWESTILK